MKGITLRGSGVVCEPRAVLFMRLTPTSISRSVADPTARRRAMSQRRWLDWAIPIAATLFFALSLYTAIERGDPPGYSNGIIHGDAAGYFAYLPSIVFDGDVNIANQNGPHWMHAPQDAGVNRYPIGTALTHLPAYLVGHGIATSLRWIGVDLSNSGYGLVYQIALAANVSLLMALAVHVLARVGEARLGLSRPASVGGAMLWWFGTHIAYYHQRDPLSPHLIGIVWVAFTVGCAHRLIATQTRGARRGWFMLAIGCLAMAAATRYTNVLFAIVIAIAGLHALRQPRHVRSFRTGQAWPGVMAGTALLLIAVLGQTWATHPGQTPAELQRGAPPGVSDRHEEPPETGLASSAGYHRHEGFYWGQPALVRILLSSRNGLFFYTPGLILASVFAFRQWRDPLMLGLIATGLVTWYVNAAWWAWWFGPNSVGNRGFLEQAPLFILGFGSMFAALASRRGWLIVAVALTLGSNATALMLHRANISTPGKPLIPAERHIDNSAWPRF